MTLLPVTDLSEKLERAKQGDNGSFHQRLFVTHLKGLEKFVGKRVLEIGGADNRNLADYFISMGAHYETVRLEKNEKGLPYVNPVRNFLWLPTDAPYDLVISSGVFEEFAINQSTNGQDHRTIYDSNERNLNQLFALTKEGGFNVIGTVSDPCMYTNYELRKTGFEIQFRASPFWTFNRSEGKYRPNDPSELVILKKVNRKKIKQENE